MNANKLRHTAQQPRTPVSPGDGRRHPGGLPKDTGLRWSAEREKWQSRGRPKTGDGGLARMIQLRDPPHGPVSMMMIPPEGG